MKTGTFFYSIILLSLVLITGCKTDKEIGSKDTGMQTEMGDSVEKAYPDSMILGKWVIDEALTLGGEPYTGTVSIERDSLLYHVHWKTSLYEKEGIGIKYGNLLFVGWGKNEFGLSYYTIFDDGTLSAKWITNTTANAFGTEKAVGGESGVVESFYSIQTFYPASDSVDTGQLIIERRDSTYDMKWVYPEQTFHGIGVRFEDLLFAGWSGDPEFGIILYRFSGNEVKGKWILMNRKAVALENLRRR